MIVSPTIVSIAVAQAVQKTAFLSRGGPDVFSTQNFVWALEQVTRQLPVSMKEANEVLAKCAYLTTYYTLVSQGQGDNILYIVQDALEIACEQAILK